MFIRFFSYTVLTILLINSLNLAQTRAGDASKPEVKKGELKDKIQEMDYELKAGQIYVFDLETKAFDAMLGIKAPGGGNFVALNDDGGKGTNARLVYLPSQSGKYKIAVGSPKLDGRGAYTLTIRSKAPVFATKDKLTADDTKDKVRKESHAKTHGLKMEAGKHYVIQLTSKDMDTYLRLENAAGKQVGENDDIDVRSRNLNSRLVYRPKQTGKFNIVVTTYEGGKTGAYDVAVFTPSKTELKGIDPVAALIGETASDVNSVFSFNGMTKKLSDLRGKVVLLDFWAVWCGPCIKSFPHLRHLHETYNKKGLEIVGVTSYYNYEWDKDAGRAKRSKQPVSQKDEHGMLQEFAKQHKLPYRIMAVSKGDWSQASNVYGVQGIPTAVVIDRAGRVRMIRVGATPENAAALEVEIRRLLEQKESN